MAGTEVKKLAEFHQDSVVDQLRLSLNAVIVDLEALRVAVDAIADKLDAEDVTNLDTDYATTAAVATAAALTAWKVSHI